MARMAIPLIVTSVLVMSFVQGSMAFAPGVFPRIFHHHHTYSKILDGVNTKKMAQADSFSSIALISNEGHKFSQRMQEYDRKSSMLMSLSIVAGCRRLSFLLISIALVNTFRTVVMKV